MAAVENLEDHRIRVDYDGGLAIATGESRFEKQWRNTSIAWSTLLKRLSKSRETHETHAQYMRMTKAQQEGIKDIGGFVGGHLRQGKRRTGYVECRQILTLDLDFPPEDLWERVVNQLRPAFALCLYSTHKHTPSKPRYRLIIPMDRETSPDEYEAIARKIAEKVGIDFFDDSTFQPTRLMYWPSNSRDVEPVFRYIDAPFLKADGVLDEYPDWTDISYWPVSERSKVQRAHLKDRQEDPTEKSGVIGAFCRAYRIPEAIETFLSDVYEPTAKEDRYTYKAGSTAAGLVVYDDGLFAYSNHSTDPAGGQLCNAFDLVRIHRFGELDEESDKAGGKAPSFKAMQDFALSDGATKLAMLDMQQESAKEDFAEEKRWEESLAMTKAGIPANTAANALLILQNDTRLQGIAKNELSGAIEVSQELPWSRPNKYWSDADEAQLFLFLSNQYGVEFSERIYQKALTKVVDDRRFNPLRDYISSLPEWDGVPRVDTLLIDYLGAEDGPYVRAVTRKTLAGAIQRVLTPGCKFDTVLVLDGKPGIGKSTLLRVLGGEFFSDSLSLADTRDKTAAEKLQGCWIMEIGEMQGMRKADVESMKGFLSRQVDEYRAAYGRVVERHPRTAIICGTTNARNGFLRDTTGNRRFWPVKVDGGGPKSVWSITAEERDQIWAEAAELVAAGETCFLDPEMEKLAFEAQQDAIEYDERQGEVEDYLNTLLPADWYSWDIGKRVDYFQQRDELEVKPEGVMQRDFVSVKEIFCECFGRPWTQWRRQDGSDITQIMSRIPGWIYEGRQKKAEQMGGYGHQRVYTRTK